MSQIKNDLTPIFTDNTDENSQEIAGKGATAT
jgi:hypothetical protein